MVKCKSADRYKGKRPPRCNGGDPCEVCLLKYENEQRIQRLEAQVKELQEATSPHHMAVYD